MLRKLEVACFTAESVKTAVKAEADRIEFCCDYKAGGLTPDINEFIKLRTITNIPIYVMIRPKPGEFVYSVNEIKVMINDIRSFYDAGADGFVFGLLKPDNTVNNEECIKLIEAAGKLPCTFHRAFDRCTDPFVAADNLISCGFTSVLSSGNKKNCLDGADLLNEIIKYSAGGISVIIGGQVRSTNIGELCKRTKSEFYHSSGIIDGYEANIYEIGKIKEILKKCSA